ncbi:MAG: hypothetical protein HC905_08795 [Bacteroidales bacterium]|nr:hypothetical protein [Bacteroidales bacterium]
MVDKDLNGPNQEGQFQDSEKNEIDNQENEQINSSEEIRQNPDENTENVESEDSESTVIAESNNERESDMDQSEDSDDAKNLEYENADGDFSKVKEVDESFNAQEVEKIDYSALSKEDLVSILKDLINKGSVLDIKDDIDFIKIKFLQKIKSRL